MNKIAALILTAAFGLVSASSFAADASAAAPAPVKHHVVKKHAKKHVAKVAASAQKAQAADASAPAKKAAK